MLEATNKGLKEHLHKLQHRHSGNNDLLEMSTRKKQRLFLTSGASTTIVNKILTAVDTEFEFVSIQAEYFN